MAENDSFDWKLKICNKFHFGHEQPKHQKSFSFNGQIQKLLENKTCRYCSAQKTARKCLKMICKLRDTKQWISINNHKFLFEWNSEMFENANILRFPKLRTCPNAELSPRNKLHKNDVFDHIGKNKFSAIRVLSE